MGKVAHKKLLSALCAAGGGYQDRSLVQVIRRSRQECKPALQSKVSNHPMIYPSASQKKRKHMATVRGPLEQEGDKWLNQWVKLGRHWGKIRRNRGKWGKFVEAMGACGVKEKKKKMEKIRRK